MASAIHRDEILEKDLEELRQRYLMLLLVVGLATLWLVCMRFLSGNRAWERTWPVVCSALVGVLGSSLLCRRHFLLAACLLAMSLATALLFEIWLVSWTLPLALLPALVVLVTAVSTPLALVTTAYALAGLLLLGHTRTLATPIAQVASLSLIAVPLAAVAASRRFHTAFAWARAAALRAEETAEEARSRREEAMKAMSAMHNAYYLLRRTNHALAQAQAELLEARRLKTEFVNTVSHELRAPLNYIVGFSELMVNSPEIYGNTPWPPGLRQDLEEIYRSSSHLARLIDDILDLAQIEAQRMILNREPVKLSTIAHEAAQMVRPWAERKGLSLQETLDGTLPPLYLDRTRMRQVVLNLLNNAIRFTEQGHIRIAVSRQDNQTVLTVSDTGPGIPPEKVDMVFQEFVQLDTGEGRPIGSSGLGLAICRKFVEMHGGRIGVESRVGQGSTFRITFPPDTSMPTVSLTKPSTLSQRYWQALQKQGLGQDVIVVVGDDGLAGNLQAEMREYEVLTTRVADLPAIIEEVRPRAIVLDGTQTTDEALKALACSSHDVPVISLPEFRSQQRSLPGAAMHLTKPIMRAQLLDAVAKVAPGAETVLAIDDDPPMRRFLKVSLESAPGGYRVLEASTAEEGWQVLHSKPVHLVLLDLWLEGTNGFDFLEQMRQEGTLDHIPVITISAYISPAEEMPSCPQGITILRKGWLGREQTFAVLRTALQEIGPRFRWEEPCAGPPTSASASPASG